MNDSIAIEHVWALYKKAEAESISAFKAGNRDESFHLISAGEDMLTSVLNRLCGEESREDTWTWILNPPTDGYPGYAPRQVLIRNVWLLS